MGRNAIVGQSGGPTAVINSSLVLSLIHISGRMQRDVIALVQGNTPSALPWRPSSGGGLRLETAGPRVYTGRTVLRLSLIHIC